MSSPPDATDHWLQLLKSGTSDQQALARTELGIIFEQRGMLDEAAEAYWTNVKARVKDTRPYERLAALARQRGDIVGEVRILTMMHGACGVDSRKAGTRSSRRPRLVFASVALVVVLIGVLFALMSAIVDLRRATNAPPLTSVLLLPRRCYDPDRFLDPDPQRALLQGLVDGGMNPYRANPMMNFYSQNAPKIVGGWVAVSLLNERAGIEAPSLAQWIGGQETLKYFMDPSEWAAMQSWPAHTCEGAFLKNPRNAAMVALLPRVVGKEFAFPSAGAVSHPVDQTTQEAVKVAILDYDRLESDAYVRLDPSQLGRRATDPMLSKVTEHLSGMVQDRTAIDTRLIEARFGAFRGLDDGSVEADIVEVWSTRYLDGQGQLQRYQPRVSRPQTVTLVRIAGNWKLTDVQHH